ncbi:MAG: peptidoglycan synthetase [Aureispira sp.]|nr:peptidoglycan synthetase [Aureispira sp.]
MRIHLIATGGALMHNLALALKTKGYNVSGSDDEIYEPSRSRLQKAGLLPTKMGWDANRIDSSIDAVIVGMHARPNNPELLKAQELGLTIYSYPEYLYQQSQDKLRVVVGGSHGKTTTTSMIMHILVQNGVDFDYAVGAQLDGFETMVRLSDAPIIVIEGDEYLSSPIDRRPKFLHYHPQIAILTGVAWDHMNVFPTFDIYHKEFGKFIETIDQDGVLIYYKPDEYLQKYSHMAKCQITAYQTPPHQIIDGQTYLPKPLYADEWNFVDEEKGILLQIFGEHNLQNMQAARLVCRELGLSDEQIFRAMMTFAGAAKRLELLYKTDQNIWFKDFAHAPSKVRATFQAVKKQYAESKLVAVLELHTFSSLNIDFMGQYKGAMQGADSAYVYYSPHTLAMKKLPALEPQMVQDAFGQTDLKVYTDIDKLKAAILAEAKQTNTNFLMMSSGNWGGVDWKKELATIYI